MKNFKKEWAVKLAKTLIENGVLYGIKVNCPDCSGIEDDQYYCTTCEANTNTSVDVEDLVRGLLEEDEK